MQAVCLHIGFAWCFSDVFVIIYMVYIDLVLNASPLCVV